ncbi:hypothetical protein NJB1907f44_37750 [Mycobacterium marinum]|nr:hypothetical protein NJB1907f34b_45220 [Mycobacterium marinum]GJO16756.1 hypothetical protein NJB1907E90_44740 [Mycobacterium marinum]GJO22646.1 hypothetical protein NJB1728e18_25510 [Mycobacterium marinum]GJO29243.1 hypothetical protein NJB1907E11_48540 [Mycobacterium marinum]GJO34563.1 hypothetical protein NJB1907f22_37770 [Mycobacterium marinum]
MPNPSAETTTCQPRLASTIAVVHPLTPAPMTTTRGRSPSVMTAPAPRWRNAPTQWGRHLSGGTFGPQHDSRHSLSCIKCREHAAWDLDSGER